MPRTVVTTNTAFCPRAMVIFWRMWAVAARARRIMPWHVRHPVAPSPSRAPISAANLGDATQALTSPTMAFGGGGCLGWCVIVARVMVSVMIPNRNRWQHKVLCFGRLGRADAMAQLHRRRLDLVAGGGSGFSVSFSAISATFTAVAPGSRSTAALILTAQKAQSIQVRTHACGSPKILPAISRLSIPKARGNFVWSVGSRMSMATAAASGDLLLAIGILGQVLGGPGAHDPLLRRDRPFVRSRTQRGQSAAIRPPRAKPADLF